MKRRSFLAMLGLASVMPAAKSAEHYEFRFSTASADPLTGMVYQPTSKGLRLLREVGTLG